MIRRGMLLAGVFFLFIAPAGAQGLPHFEPVPGGVALVEIKQEARPRAYYKNRPVMVLGEAGAWQAIIGIPLTATPGTHALLIKNGVAEKYPFVVRDKAYQTQRITISDKRKVNPAPVDMERINQERPVIQKAKTHWSDAEQVPLRLSIPVQGPYSSPFGLRRFFNGQARRPHSGLDIAAPEGTPIQAPAKGKIINTGEYFFNGGTVFIDHGQGMVTLYCHMSKIEVARGQVIQRGEIIGAVGQTGRVTGAHLHWGVILNGVLVNPELFLPRHTDPG